MSTAPLPDGYDQAFSIDCAGHDDCLITVGIDIHHGNVLRFVVRLHLRGPGVQPIYTVIARFDHNGTGGPDGHDIREEGLHLDIRTPEGIEKAYPRRGELPDEMGKIIQGCTDYFHRHADYFVDTFRGIPPSDEFPDDVPDWIGK